MHPVPVQTVLGPIDASELGVTLTHEHSLRQPPELSYDGVRPFSRLLRHAPVTADNAWLVREDPYASFDNRSLTDFQTVVDEIAVFTARGGRTIVDNSNGPERDPGALVRLAEATGVNIVMGSGRSVTPGATLEAIESDPYPHAAELVEEHRSGIPLSDGRRAYPGIIGEIGVGPTFNASEKSNLAAAAIAQKQVGVPLLIHLPGWQRRGHEVLDVVLGHGVSPAAVVLCHMDPSGRDPGYQRELAARGVWLEFDMIGMLNNYPGEGQSPSVQDTVEAVAGLISGGLQDQLLLSQDVGMKTMWTRFGGNGYGFVQAAFLPRLMEAGVEGALEKTMLTDNPRKLFTSAHHGIPAARA
jgi:phosphotriesterase-related protein